MEKRTPDERIAGLTYAAFEEEFEFRPGSKVEQKLFALKGRKPDPRILQSAERVDEMMKQGPPQSEPLPEK